MCGLRSRRSVRVLSSNTAAQRPIAMDRSARERPAKREEPDRLGRLRTRPGPYSHHQGPALLTAAQCRAGHVRTPAIPDLPLGMSNVGSARPGSAELWQRYLLVWPLGQPGVFLPPNFVVGQERLQECDAGLYFRDVNVQLGHHPPDLVLTRAHDWPLPISSSPRSAKSSASLSATSCRWAIASAATARISAGVMVCLGLARAASSSALISPGPGRLAARERTTASRTARSVPKDIPGDRSSAMSSKTFRYSSLYRSRGARLPRSHCGIIFTRPRWAATFSPVSLAALRSSRAIRGTSQPLASRHWRNVWLVTSVIARVPRVPRELPGRWRAPVRSRFAPSVSLCHAVNM